MDDYLYDDDDGADTLAALAYLLSILVCQISPAINMDAAEELLFNWLENDPSETSAAIVGMQIARTSGVPTSTEWH
jgi:hypothetical protein